MLAGQAAPQVREEGLRKPVREGEEGRQEQVRYEVVQVVRHPVAGSGQVVRTASHS
jgi:hypothetical protein